MSQRKTYYEFLGVTRQATPEQIQRRYQDLMGRYDRNAATNKAEAEKVYRQIELAYQVLRDPKRRADYDRTLAQVMPPAARQTPAKPVAATPPPAQAPPQPAPRRSPPPSPLQSRAMNRLLRQAEGDALAEAGAIEEALAAYRDALGPHPNPPLEAKIARLEERLARRAGTDSEEAGDAEDPAGTDRQPFWRRLLRRDGTTG